MPCGGGTGEAAKPAGLAWDLMGRIELKRGAFALGLGSLLLGAAIPVLRAAPAPPKARYTLRRTRSGTASILPISVARRGAIRSTSPPAPIVTVPHSKELKTPLLAGAEFMGELGWQVRWRAVRQDPPHHAPGQPRNADAGAGRECRGVHSELQQIPRRSQRAPVRLRYPEADPDRSDQTRFPWRNPMIRSLPMPFACSCLPPSRCHVPLRRR